MEDTWRLMDERVSARRKTKDQSRIWRLSRAIVESLKGDRRRRVETAPEREHSRYLSGRKQLPLRPPAEPTREDDIFAALQRDAPKPHARERRKNRWIL